MNLERDADISVGLKKLLFRVFTCVEFNCNLAENKRNSFFR
jgi:hypothetical protein